MENKLTKLDIGGYKHCFVGCALTGSCGSAAADYEKYVTLSEADTENISDGMLIACTFAEGNSAGNAPTPQTIYSSDQEHYYSDPGLTTPVTLPDPWCCEIEYTGAGNAYTLITFPYIIVGNISGPLCDSKGRYIGGAVWNAGDVLLLLYTNEKFLAINL